MTTGEHLVGRILKRVANRYRTGQGQATVSRSTNIEGLLCGRLTFVTADGAANLIQMIRAEREGITDAYGDPVACDAWEPELGATAALESISTIIPPYDVIVSDKMIAALDDAAQRLQGSTP